MPTGSRAERFAAVTDLNIPWRDETMDAYSSIFIDDREQERASAKPMIDESVVTGDLTELVSGSVAREARSAKAGRLRVSRAGHRRLRHRGAGLRAGAGKGTGNAGGGVNPRR